VQAVELAVSDSKLALATSGVHTLAQAVQAASQSGIITTMQSHLCAAATRAALNEAHPHLCFNALACLADCGTALASAGVGMPGYVRFLALHASCRHKCAVRVGHPAIVSEAGRHVRLQCAAVKALRCNHCGVTLMCGLANILAGACVGGCLVTVVRSI
jgi:hypothetical protein